MTQNKMVHPVAGRDRGTETQEIGDFSFVNPYGSETMLEEEEGENKKRSRRDKRRRRREEIGGEEEETRGGQE